MTLVLTSLGVVSGICLGEEALSGLQMLGGPLGGKKWPRVLMAKFSSILDLGWSQPCQQDPDLDGQLVRTICCVSLSPQPHLSPVDVGFFQGTVSFSPWAVIGGGIESQGNVPAVLTCHSWIMQLLGTSCVCLTSSQLHLTLAIAQASTSVGLYLLCMETTSPQTCDLFLKALEDGVLLSGELTVLQLCSDPTHYPYTHSPHCSPILHFQNPFPLGSPQNLYFILYKRALCSPLLCLAKDSLIWSLHYKSLCYHIICMI